MARLAYFFSTFPALTTTFLQRELSALNILGVEPILVANRQPSAEGFQPQDARFLNSTFYLTPARPGNYSKALARAAGRSPRKVWKSFKLAFELKDDFPWQRLKNFCHCAGAALLAEHLLENQVEHIHVHFAFGAASVALFLNVLTGIPYSISIHGSDVLLPRPLTEEKLKGAAFIVSNCDFHIKNLQNRFPSLRNARFYVVPLSINLQSGMWSRVEPPNQCPPLRILNVGRLVKVKAQDLLIRSCVELRKRKIAFECRIVGEGPERNFLEKLIRHYDLNGVVRLLGACNENEVAEFIAKSHVMVLSSRSEGTPMSIIEAMAKARPAVAPAITALPEMIIDGQTGYLYEPGSVKELTNRLALLAERSELITSMGLAARKRAERFYDHLQNAEKLKDVFAAEMASAPHDAGQRDNNAIFQPLNALPKDGPSLWATINTL